MYDMGGMESVRKLAQEDERGGAPQDPFAAMFGGGQQRGGLRGSEGKLTSQMTLDDLYNGAPMNSKIKRRVVCRNCSGKTGGKCAQCGPCPSETRMVQKQMGHMIVQQEEQVPSNEKCRQEETSLDASVERGIPDGHQIRFKFKSEQSPGKVPGDVVVTIRTKKHATFTRDGNDLHMLCRGQRGYPG